MTTFDPKKVNINFGPLPLRGFADGTMITVAFQGDGATSAVGATGEAVIIKNHDRRATVTARLMGTGAGRNTLAALAASFTAGNPQLPLSITSIDTGEQIGAGSAVIKRMPDFGFGGEAPVREVVFEVPQMDVYVAPEV